MHRPCHISFSGLKAQWAKLFDFLEHFIWQRALLIVFSACCCCWQSTDAHILTYAYVWNLFHLFAFGVSISWQDVVFVDDIRNNKCLKFWQLKLAFAKAQPASPLGRATQYFRSCPSGQCVAFHVAMSVHIKINK